MKFLGNKAGMKSNEQIKEIVNSILSKTTSNLQEKKLIKDDEQRVKEYINRLKLINKKSRDRVRGLKKLVILIRLKEQ